ncbi:MAG: hypothetical protein ABJB65_08225, partial [Chloroflexota bacterium]
VSPAGHLEHPEDVSTPAVEQKLHPLGLLPVAAGHLELGVNCGSGAPVRLNRVIRGPRDLVRGRAQHPHSLVGPRFGAHRAVE